MGSFIGHIDEAIVFIILATWWMYNGFTNYIKSNMGIGQFNFQMSYVSRIRGRKVPLEQILKFLFPLAALLGELIDSELYFINDKGQWAGAHYLIHISIYSFFVIHAIVDILLKLGVKCIAPKMEFFTAGLAFFWYGLGVYYHAHMKQKKVLETVIHVLPVYFIYLEAFTCFLATKWSNSFILDLFRCYALAILGTWFFQVSFIMYKPGIPGTHANWNRTDMENVHVAPALFGFHMGLTTVFIMLFYGFCYWLVSKTTSSPPAKYQKVMANNNMEEAVSLMEESD